MTEALFSWKGLWQAVSWAWKKLFGQGGAAQTANGSGIVQVQAGQGASVSVAVNVQPEAKKQEPAALSVKEIFLLKVAAENQGRLYMLRESMSGRSLYVGPFEEAQDIEAELQHLLDLELLEQEFSASRTIKFRLKHQGWERAKAEGKS